MPPPSSVVGVQEAGRLAEARPDLAGHHPHLDVEGTPEDTGVDHPLQVLGHGIEPVGVARQHLHPVAVHRPHHFQEVCGRAGELLLHVEVLARLRQLGPRARDLCGRKNDPAHVEVLVGYQVVHVVVERRAWIVLPGLRQQVSVRVLAVRDDLRAPHVLQRLQVAGALSGLSDVAVAHSHYGNLQVAASAHVVLHRVLCGGHRIACRHCIA